MARQRSAPRYERFARSIRAVIHMNNNAPFVDIVAIVDALHTPKRAAETKANAFPAFSVSFATD